MEKIDLGDALNAGSYHPEGISKSNSNFLNKFAVFVGDEQYLWRYEDNDSEASF